MLVMTGDRGEPMAVPFKLLVDLSVKGKEGRSEAQLGENTYLVGIHCCPVTY